MQKDFDEVPAEAVNQLRASLIQLLLHFAKGPSNLRIQLSLAISALAIHVPAQQWEGGSVIQWFVSCIRSVPPEQALPCLLELLKVLPQARAPSTVSISGWADAAEPGAGLNLHVVPVAAHGRCQLMPSLRTGCMLGCRQPVWIIQWSVQS